MTTNHVIWLRASEQQTGRTYNLESVFGKAGDDGGIAHGRLLVEFAEAVIGEDDARLLMARDRLAEAAAGRRASHDPGNQLFV